MCAWSRSAFSAGERLRHGRRRLPRPRPRSRLRRVARLDKVSSHQRGERDKASSGRLAHSHLPAAASAGCWRALRASGASRSLQLPRPAQAQPREGALRRAGWRRRWGWGSGVYIRVDEMMARGRKKHLCVASSTRGGRHLSRSSGSKSISGSPAGWDQLGIGEATEVAQRAMWGNEERVKR